MKAVILGASGYEDLELWFPFMRLKQEGIDIEVAAKSPDPISGKYGYPLKPTMLTSALNAKKFDAVIVPGGIKGGELLRMDSKVLEFVKDMDKQKKVIASICHGAWVLVSADILSGRNATCYEGMKDDLVNAGAKYFDKEVMVDDNLITSRKPQDLPAFMTALLKSFI